MCERAYVVVLQVGELACCLRAPFPLCIFLLFFQFTFLSLSLLETPLVFR